MGEGGGGGGIRQIMLCLEVCWDTVSEDPICGESALERGAKRLLCNLSKPYITVPVPTFRPWGVGVPWAWGGSPSAHLFPTGSAV